MVLNPFIQCQAEVSYSFAGFFQSGYNPIRIAKRRDRSDQGEGNE